MTLATLRALHAIIGDAIQEIERVYAEQSHLQGEEQSPTPAPSPSPITPSTPYDAINFPRDDMLRTSASYIPMVESIESMGESIQLEEGIVLGGPPGVGLGAPFSPKTKKATSRLVLGDTRVLGNTGLREDFNSPPLSPVLPNNRTPTTPSPPSSQRRTLRTWQSMATLSPSMQNELPRDSPRGSDDSSHVLNMTPTRRNSRDNGSPPPPIPPLPEPYRSAQMTARSTSLLRTPKSTPPGASPFVSSLAFPASDPPTPSTEQFAFLPSPSFLDSRQTCLDFPSLDEPYDGSSPAEVLNSTHPTVVTAIARIVAASGQLAATAQNPFLSICDAVMQYHLPACMRLFEASHTPEILHEAGPQGLHVDKIAMRNGVDPGKLAHILRLLATHHILREVQPDVFALNRISSLVDTGKDAAWLLGEKREQRGDLKDRECHNLTRDRLCSGKRNQEECAEERPEKKYEDTNGIAAFVGMCTDELFKCASYMTEAYYLSNQTKYSREPVHAPFNFAFDTRAGFFGWLEGEDADATLPRNELGAELGPALKTASMVTGGRDVGFRGQDRQASRRSHLKQSSPSSGGSDEKTKRCNANRFRLERFGKAMVGTGSWEAPSAILHGFDWVSLPQGSTIVDVGGGIGSTSMLLANALTSRSEDGCDLRLKFIIQDRPVVVEMGEKAWRSQCPELLESGTARFQVHDFFTPQPIKNAAVFLLRVVLHDWPDSFAEQILLRLREAATEDTKLIIADFVLPLACADHFGVRGDSSQRLSEANSKHGNVDAQDHKTSTDRHDVGPDDDQIADDLTEGVEGAQSRLAPAPLLANLGKASANAYWMDLTMQVTFNSQERTLREIDALTRSAGWKIVKVTHAPGSLFGYIVAVPVAIPPRSSALAKEGTKHPDVLGTVEGLGKNIAESGAIHGARSIQKNPPEIGFRCGTPTFGSRALLPSRGEGMIPMNGRFGKVRQALTSGVAFGRSIPRPLRTSISKQNVVQPASTPTPSKLLKKRPSPLAVPLPPTASRAPASPHLPRSPSISRRSSFANLHRHNESQSRVMSPIPAVPSLPRQTTPIGSRPRSSTIGTRLPTPVSRAPPISPVVQWQSPPVPQLPRSLILSAVSPKQQQIPSSPVAMRQSQRMILRRKSHVLLSQDTSRQRADGVIVSTDAVIGGETNIGSNDKEAGVSRANLDITHPRITSGGRDVLVASGKIGSGHSNCSSPRYSPTLL